jgi:hypothetical protein
MDQRIVAGTATEPLEFLLVLASDHRTGATGIAPTVRLSKAGGAFAVPAGAVAEVGQRLVQGGRQRHRRRAPSAR